MGQAVKGSTPSTYHKDKNMSNTKYKVKEVGGALALCISGPKFSCPATRDAFEVQISSRTKKADNFVKVKYSRSTNAVKS